MNITTILDSSQLEAVVKKLAHEIINQYPTFDNVILIGIQRRGVPIAQRLQNIIETHCNQSPLLGTLDINFYRDDWTTRREHPIIGESNIPVSLDAANVILVDDVLFTGRTIRAALEAIVNYGRPACISLLVLVDRGHRELPIQPDFVGHTVQTTTQDNINVFIKEMDGNDAVILEQT